MNLFWLRIGAGSVLIVNLYSDVPFAAQAQTAKGVKFSSHRDISQFRDGKLNTLVGVDVPFRATKNEIEQINKALGPGPVAQQQKVLNAKKDAKADLIKRGPVRRRPSSASPNKSTLENKKAMFLKHFFPANWRQMKWIPNDN
jgi:hypothetical protein